MPMQLTRREVLRRLVSSFIALFSLASLRIRKARAKGADDMFQKEGYMELPQPRTEGRISVEKAIRNRRTIRSFTPESLGLEQFSQLLWAAQGITEDRGFKRTAPSAGALYPMDIYAVVGTSGIEGLTPGVYHYNAAHHAVSVVSKGDLRKSVARAAFSQMWIAGAPLSFVLTAEYDRTTI